MIPAAAWRALVLVLIPAVVETFDWWTSQQGRGGGADIGGGFLILVSGPLIALIWGWRDGRARQGGERVAVWLIADAAAAFATALLVAVVGDSLAWSGVIISLVMFGVPLVAMSLVGVLIGRSMAATPQR